MYICKKGIWREQKSLLPSWNEWSIKVWHWLRLWNQFFPQPSYFFFLRQLKKKKKDYRNHTQARHSSYIGYSHISPNKTLPSVLSLFPFCIAPWNSSLLQSTTAWRSLLKWCNTTMDKTINDLTLSTTYWSYIIWALVTFKVSWKNWGNNSLWCWVQTPQNVDLINALGLPADQILRVLLPGHLSGASSQLVL